MSRTLVLWSTVVGCLTVFGASPVSAQFIPSAANRPSLAPPVGRPPQLSPYLDLTRGGIPAVNYFLGTIPEIQRRENYSQLRTAIQEAEIRAATPPPEDLNLGRPLDMTGHPTAFGYYSSFYPQLNPGGGAGRTPLSPARR